MTPEPLVPLTLARVLRPWGRRGEVAAEILTDFPERLNDVGRVWLADERGARSREATIVSSRVHCGQAVIRFDGVASIDDAEKLRGLEIQIPLSERAALPSDQHYISDLIGCSVFEKGVDPAAQRIVVRLPDGLRELNS